MLQVYGLGRQGFFPASHTESGETEGRPWYKNCSLKGRPTMTVEGHCSGRKDNRMARHRYRETTAFAILFKSTHLSGQKEKLFRPSKRIIEWRARFKDVTETSLPSKENWQGFRLNANYYYIMIGQR